MKNKVSAFLVTVILVGTLVIAFDARPVEASGTICVRADGSIDPPTAPISTADNVTYVFTADINNQSISVQRNNTTIDGRGHTLQGSHVNFSFGINLSNVTNVTVENTRIDAFWYGIFLDSGSNHKISGNNITNNADAIFLQSTTNDSISENNITDNNGWGVVFFDSHDETLFRNNITNNHNGGVALGPSSNDDISENNIANNTGDGIMLYGIFNHTTFKSSTTGNTITRNNIKNNKARGIKLISSTHNTISRNNIIENQLAIEANYSSYNMIYNNNFVSNAQQVLCKNSWNTWDCGYPSGGNYWSEYAGIDYNQGSGQNISGSDGIGDSGYRVDRDPKTPPELLQFDKYPLMGPISDFDATLEHHVQIISNSTISDFQFNGTAVSFNVSEEDGTIGFCRMCIPTAMMNATYRVFVNSTEVAYTLLLCSDADFSYLYFNYTHSTQEVIVIPEFSSFLILPLFMIAALAAIIALRKGRKTKNWLEKTDRIVFYCGCSIFLISL